MRTRLIAQTVSAALHVAVLVWLAVQSRALWLPPAPEIAATPERQHIQIEFVPPDRLLPADPAPPPADFDVGGLALDELTVDVARITAREHALLPFLTLDLMFLERVERDAREAAARLVNPFAGPGAAGALSPLDASDTLLQQITDRAWSRRERWTHFAEIAALTETHDPHRGRLPELIRYYLDQNILQPYCDGVRRDPRFWAMLENAADHADFVDFIRSYARRAPSSRTTTELLFLLDELAQASRDVVIMLVETRPDRDLTHTQSLSAEAYALAERIRHRYVSWLFERGLDKVSVRRRYDGLRLRILETIVTVTPDGYRVADAQYLAGQVLFEMNRLPEAERVWRSMRPVEGDAYYRASTELLTALARGPIDATAARRILGGEYGRWRVFSIDRLRRFGHHCDTF